MADGLQAIGMGDKFCRESYPVILDPDSPESGGNCPSIRLQRSESVHLESEQLCALWAHG